MILVDTSIWVDHLHSEIPRLADELNTGQVLTHSLVIAELAVGNIKRRSQFLALLGDLPTIAQVAHLDVMQLVEHHRLHGIGLGAVDIHLLAALVLAPGARLWTRDERLNGAARRLALATV